MSLIFTNNSAWSGSDGRARFVAFAALAREAVFEGGRVKFIRLTSPRSVLEERLANPSRQQLKKLVGIPRLRELLASLDDSVLYDDDLTIDTSRHSADKAALAISAYLGSGDGARESHTSR